MANRPARSGSDSPASSEPKTGSPSKRGNQHQTTVPCASINAPIAPLPTSARSREVTFGKSLTRPCRMRWKGRLCKSGAEGATLCRKVRGARSSGDDSMTKTCTFVGLAAVLLSGVGNASRASAQPRTIQPVLGFPEQGLDDSAAYQGYQTRFFRDAKGNVVQVYLDARSGRVVTLLADAVNESVGFTVRDGTG